MAEDTGLLLVAFVIILIVGLIYFLPAIIAFNRKHNNKIPILVINLFLGGTFIGWVISLAWSLTENTE